MQIDGSEHDWLEGRGPRVVLMVIIDDATNTTLARFYPAEDTAAAYDIFERYVRRYGLPVALYPDRDSIYLNFARTSALLSYFVNKHGVQVIFCTTFPFNPTGYEGIMQKR